MARELPCDACAFFVMTTEQTLDMLAIGGGAFSDVDSYVKDCALDATDNLALGVRGLLEMETAHHAIAGFALVILDEGYL